jgi:predicted ATPase/DNA-binding winged helix-turn-helix (wHTH) protein
MVHDDTAAGEDVVAFGPFQLSRSRRLLEVAGRPIHLGGRALDILLVLIDRAGEVVSKRDIIAAVWPDVTVEEGSLRFHVAALRKALDDGDGGVRYVANVPGRGYCFVVPISRSKTAAPEPQAAAPLTRAHNLPPRLLRMVGRDHTVRAISDKLAANRFTTIVGLGGIGKTTVAISVAHALLDPFDGAVHFIDLGTLSDPNLVAGTVANALGIQVNSGNAVPGVVNFLHDKRLLLVLDSCEHVIETVSAMSERLFSEAPLLHILATSQEPMLVEGEHVHSLAPLDYPPNDSRLTSAEALGFPAVQVFMDRVTASSDRPPLGDHEAPTVAEICRKLDGIPLAIEFAAARAATLGIPQVAARLDDRLSLLTRGRRTALPRHRTLRSVLDWSYGLLPESEQRLLRCLALFSGGFTLEAAVAVLGDDAGTSAAVVERISNLTIKSLVTLDMSTGLGRWRLLETTRAYALEKLGESGETEWAAQRHAEFFRDFFAAIETRSQIEATPDDLVRYRQEIDNVRAALDWAFSPAGDASIGVTLTAAYAWIWLNLSLYFECRERVEQALDRIAADAERGDPLHLQLLVALAIALTNIMGPVDRTRDVLVTALRLAERQDDLAVHLWLLWALWALQLNIGDCREAQATAELYCCLAARTGDPGSILPGFRLLGTAQQLGGHQGQAAQSLARALEHPLSVEDPLHPVWPRQHRAMTLATMVRTLWLQGFVDQARDKARESYEEASAGSVPFLRFEVLRLAVCPIALLRGDMAAADHAVTQMAGIAASTNAISWVLMSECFEATLLIRRGRFESGTTLLRTALNTCETSGRKPSYPEYLGILAEGLAGLGRYAEAVSAIDRALAVAEQGGERWYLAELLRTKGEFLLQGGGSEAMSAAESCFHDALRLACDQGALSWSLRTATSLARLKAAQGRRNDGREILGSVYHGFTEGFETADLRFARAMLDSY